MHFCLVTYGSRGDVQPFIYLAMGLKAKDHTVTLAAPGNFAQLIKSYGIDFYPLCGDAEEIVKAPKFRKIISGGSNIAFTRLVMKNMRDMQLPILDGVYEACKGADAIIVVNTCFFYAAAVAEKLHKKWLIVQLNPPMVPTKAFPMLMFNFPDISWLNSYTYTFINDILWRIQKKDNVIFRKRLDLPSLKGSLIDKTVADKVPIIHAFSPELISRPADWDKQFVISGFFNQPNANDNTFKAPKELEEWLTAGEKPLYIGFGSIPFPKTEQLATTINGLLVAGVRVIYCQGWSDLPDVPPKPNLFIIKETDHGWLLPKCSAALIHGGIGTVAAVLNAGIPAIVASLFVDQPVWGKIIQQKNLGVHIPWRKLSAQRVLNALKKVKQASVTETIAGTHERLVKEDGIASAIKTIEDYCN